MMIVKPDEIAIAEKLVAAIGGPEVKAKDVWNWAAGESYQTRIMAAVRTYATKVKFGVFAVDQTFLDALKAAPTKKAGKGTKAPKADAPKKTKDVKAPKAAEGTVKIGKRELNQLQQLANATAKQEVGEVMYEADLLAKGAKQISQEEARELVQNGQVVYAIDRTFDTGIAVPPLAVDLTDKKTKVEFFVL